MSILTNKIIKWEGGGPPPAASGSLVALKWPIATVLYLILSMQLSTKHLTKFIVWGYAGCKKIFWISTNKIG